METRLAGVLTRTRAALVHGRHWLWTDSTWRSSSICSHARLGQCIGEAGADPHHGGFLDAELHCDGVGGLEATATHIARQYGFLAHDLDGVATVGLVDAHGARRADTMAVQAHHDFPHGLLLGKGGDNAGSACGPMPSTSRSR